VPAVVAVITVCVPHLLLEPCFRTEHHDHRVVESELLRGVAFPLFLLGAAAGVTIIGGLLVPAPFDKCMLVERFQVVGVESIAVVLQDGSFEEDFTLGVRQRHSDNLGAQTMLSSRGVVRCCVGRRGCGVVFIGLEVKDHCSYTRMSSAFGHCLRDVNRASVAKWIRCIAHLES
jgi:hypothetical protein